MLGIVGAHRLCAAAPLPSAARKRSSPPQQQRASTSIGSRPASTATPTATTAAAGYLLVPAVLVRLLLPVAGAVRGLPLPARPQRARRRLRRRAGGGDRLHRAVHGRRHALGRGAHAAVPAALDRASACCSRWHRAGLAGARLSLPDHAHRARDAAAGRRGPPAQRGALRPRRLRRGGRLDAADPDRARAPVAACRADGSGRQPATGGRADGSRSSRSPSACSPAPASGWCCGRAPSR